MADILRIKERLRGVNLTPTEATQLKELIDARTTLEDFTQRPPLHRAATDDMGNVIGPDGLVNGPGGQRLTPHWFAHEGNPTEPPPGYRA